MMGAGLLNTTRSFKLVALKFCVPGSITIFHKFIYVFFLCPCLCLGPCPLDKWARKITHPAGNPLSCPRQLDVSYKNSCLSSLLAAKDTSPEGHLCLSNRNSVPMT